jgi:hypothetical protein
MLTIRINGLQGNQIIFEAAYVIREPGRVEQSEGCLEFYDASHAQCHEPAHYGTVYVMNDHGKTVAAYNLGMWDEGRSTAGKQTS